MIEIAFKMLFGERAKYAMLVSGICFSTLLMTQGLTMFFGIVSFSYATAKNIRAPIWVTDPLTEQVSDNQPLRDTDVDRVRSVEGVEWAAPLYVGNSQARLVDQGRTKPVTLIGLDAATLAGAPTKVIKGSLKDLRLGQSVVIDERVAQQLSTDPRQPLDVGDVFEMNDRRAVIVGIVSVSPGIGGASYVFTTWDRATQYAPNQRKMLTYVLASPAEGRTTQEVTAAIETNTGLQAVTESEFKTMTAEWMIYNSPIPFVVGLIVGIGFLVGVVVSGQTFYSFVLENTRNLGALKAMGTSDGTLARMIVTQAMTVGLIGFGLGGGFISIFLSAMPEDRVPLLMLWPVPVIVLAAVLAICAVAALLSVYRVARIEPAIVFRN